MIYGSGGIFHQPVDLQRCRAEVHASWECSISYVTEPHISSTLISSAFKFSVLLGATGVRSRAEASEHGVHRSLLCGVCPQNHGFRPFGEHGPRPMTPENLVQ